MLFAVLGALAWLQAMTQPTSTLSSLLLGIVGGLFDRYSDHMQAILSCLIACGCSTGGFSGREIHIQELGAWLFRAILSIVAVAVPVVLLYMVGAVSPAPPWCREYPSGYQCESRLQSLAAHHCCFLSRCLFTCLSRSLPCCRVPITQRRAVLFVSALGGFVLALRSSALLQPGPLRTVLGVVGRKSFGVAVLTGLLGAAVIYGVVAFADCYGLKKSSSSRTNLPSSRPW